MNVIILFWSLLFLSLIFFIKNKRKSPVRNQVSVEEKWFNQ
ncbi:MAG: hypothetical protein ACJ0QO_01355 [Parvicellaceae bacterium]